MADSDSRTSPTITVKPDGPYLVTGSVPLVDKEHVVSEKGEPLTWRTAPTGEERKTYALCRCGQSDNKPFCDGTHASAEWDGTETAPTDSYDDRRDDLGGTGITVYDDRGICQHAGFCGNKVSNVWKMAPKTDDTVVRSQVMAMVERCPSGALTYSVDGETVEPALAAEIGVVPDGPLWVTGAIPVERSDGEAMETRPRVTLCRCGASGIKPLCDGSHADIDFTG